MYKNKIKITKWIKPYYRKDGTAVCGHNKGVWSGSDIVLSGKKEIDWLRNDDKKKSPLYDLPTEKSHKPLFRGTEWMEFRWRMGVERSFESDYSPFSVSFTGDKGVALDFYREHEWGEQDTDSDLKEFSVLLMVRKNALVGDKLLYIPEIPYSVFINDSDLVDHVWQADEWTPEGEFLLNQGDYFIEQVENFDEMLDDEMIWSREYADVSIGAKNEVESVIKSYREWKKTAEEYDDFVDEWSNSIEDKVPYLFRIEKAYSIAQGEREYVTLLPPEIKPDNAVLFVSSEAQKKVILDEFPAFKDSVEVKNKEFFRRKW